jgi:hypothetical protein
MPRKKTMSDPISRVVHQLASAPRVVSNAVHSGKPKKGGRYAEDGSVVYWKPGRRR